MTRTSPPHISRRRFDAVIFDLDGVITDTARTHYGAWKEVFDTVAERHGQPPFTESDYRSYVDGKPRLDGIRSFLEARRIELDEGSPDDPAGHESVQAIARRKNERFRRRLQAGQVDLIAGAVTLLDRLDAHRFALGLVSSSKNAGFVLEQVGLDDRFAVRVDGTTIARHGLPGKPSPAMFLEAADRLDVPPARAVVIEDAESGVAAGRAGDFGLVIGRADATDEQRRLIECGADVAVADLADVIVDDGATSEAPTR